MSQQRLMRNNRFERVDRMTATVEDVIRIMESLAPPILAEKWDNTGLQVGQRNWEVHSAWIALDPLPEVVEAASRAKIDLLITHHPLIFNPLKAIDFGLPVGKIIQMAAENQLAIYAAHTNFDSVSGGLNDIFARRIGLKNIRPLIGGSADTVYKLVVFAPVEHEQKLVDALIEIGTGVIDGYQPYAFRARGKGTFLPDQVASPEAGKRGHRSDVEEVRIESVVLAHALPAVLEHLRTYLPGEMLVYDVYPLVRSKANQGIGRWGELTGETNLQSLSHQVKDIFGLKTLRMVGEPELKVKEVAVCTGSGGGLIPRFLTSTAAVFISGDIRYHHARDVQAARRGLIDVGHFASEHIMVPVLTKQLRAAVVARDLKVNVSACPIERDPFVII